MYSDNELLLIQKMVAKKINPYKLIGQWFLGEEPVRGFSKFKAPEINKNTLDKILILYKYSLNPISVDHFERNCAGFIASIPVWFALFKDDFKRFMDIDDLLPEDILNQDVSTKAGSEQLKLIVAGLWHIDHKVRGVAFDMCGADVFRIVNYSDEELLKQLIELKSVKFKP